MIQDVKFPGITSFDKLFTDFENRGKSDAITRRGQTYQERYAISIDGDSYEYGSVVPTNLVREYIENQMIDIRDVGCHFKVIVRADDTVLVVASYDQILGGHWLAYIDKSTLPEINS